jgi:hypothetical protein
MSLGGGIAGKLGFSIIAEAIPSLGLSQNGDRIPQIDSFRLSINPVNIFPFLSGCNMPISNSFSGDYSGPHSASNTVNGNPFALLILWILWTIYILRHPFVGF